MPEFIITTEITHCETYSVIADNKEHAKELHNKCKSEFLDTIDAYDGKIVDVEENENV